MTESPPQRQTLEQEQGQKQNRSPKVLLCILDGWGVRPTPGPGDATQKAPFFKKLCAENPFTLLEASGPAVGLPEGQMGNSEVGHATLGLGRVLQQDLCRIDAALSSGAFARHSVLQKFIQNRKEKGGAAHVAGLLSQGGVHSHMRHILAAVQILAAEHIPVCVHAFLDGRDTPPRSALAFLEEFTPTLPANVRIVSLCGRFYAMDRDKRWERTEDAYRLIAEQDGYLVADDFHAVFEEEYYGKISDEFIEPTFLGTFCPPHPNDGLLFMNFRADRARQLVRALGDSDFKEFPRKAFPRFADIISLTEYDETFQSFCTPMFQKESLQNSLGACLAAQGKKQLRVAETEKYAHVTFFLSGQEAPFEGEERILIPSPKVAVYNSAPKMSADEITREVVAALESERFDGIIVNYANADMIGHTGDLAAAEQALACVDQNLQRLVAAAEAHAYVVLLTADHGNAEYMREADGSPHTAHTTNPVPFVAVHAPKSWELSPRATAQPGLQDMAPTVLFCLGLEAPAEMTGESLLQSVGASHASA
ncbi:2,3-bisphosphoglycerate-independent phosphoglycerate mutase [Alphaproteobacteria bacterium]|nr:2,3-bisphosphoglycerate-independent phosphoglycerate mutase [Alphaproteobacteria bacterium]GHS98983.1 2,3-bisphosphoglycerate-independent phosphoglycerate mutase [Alphaproteobacteria bacterium]